MVRDTQYYERLFRGLLRSNLNDGESFSECTGHLKSYFIGACDGIVQEDLTNNELKSALEAYDIVQKWLVEEFKKKLLISLKS